MWRSQNYDCTFSHRLAHYYRNYFYYDSLHRYSCYCRFIVYSQHCSYCCLSRAVLEQSEAILGLSGVRDPRSGSSSSLSSQRANPAVSSTGRSCSVSISRCQRKHEVVLVVSLLLPPTPLRFCRNHWRVYVPTVATADSADFVEREREKRSGRTRTQQLSTTTTTKRAKNCRSSSKPKQGTASRGID